jgi:hypothetical protein
VFTATVGIGHGRVDFEGDAGADECAGPCVLVREGEAAGVEVVDVDRFVVAVVTFGGAVLDVTAGATAFSSGAAVSASRRRLVPLEELSLRPIAVAFIRIWCLLYTISISC